MTAMNVPTTPVVVNGLNTTALGGVITMLKAHPEGGRVTFYAKSRWQDGARAFTTFKGYAIDGQMQHEHERQFVMLSDEPHEFGATDTTPGPVEALLYAVGACITATTNANAALMGVTLTRLEVALESDLDLHGLFGLDNNVRPGIGELCTTITIAGDADEATLREIASRGYSFSPVRESVNNGVAMKPNVVVAG